mgnify:CR=1 FL=1
MILLKNRIYYSAAYTHISAVKNDKLTRSDGTLLFVKNHVRFAVLHYGYVYPVEIELDELASTPKRRRIWEVDFLRGLMILFVVWDHLMWDFAYFGNNVS